MAAAANKLTLPEIATRTYDPAPQELRMIKSLFGRSRAGRTAPPAAKQTAAPAGRPTAALFASGSFNPKVGWWTDPAWLARYERHLLPDGAEGRHPHRILDRRFTLAQFAGSVRGLAGCTAECGVYRGVGSALIGAALQGTYADGERHFGFDSFEGLPETGADDAKWRRGDLAEPMTTAARHLAEFPFVELIRGWLPQSLVGVSDRRFRLIHIDVDIEQTTWDCLEFFYPRAVPGAVFLFDDYGFHSCPGARKAVDAFLQGKPETLIELTTGQAVLYKR